MLLDYTYVFSVNTGRQMADQIDKSRAKQETHQIQGLLGCWLNGSSAQVPGKHSPKQIPPSTAYDRTLGSGRMIQSDVPTMITGTTTLPLTVRSLCHDWSPERLQEERLLIYTRLA